MKREAGPAAREVDDWFDDSRISTAQGGEGVVGLMRAAVSRHTLGAMGVDRRQERRGEGREGKGSEKSTTKAAEAGMDCRQVPLQDACGSGHSSHWLRGWSRPRPKMVL